MSIDRSFERIVADALADEAPMHGPSGLAESVLALTRGQKPRPRWLTVIKESPMRLDSRPAFGSPVARTAGVLALTLILALLAVGTVVAGASLLPSPSGLIPADRGVFTLSGKMAWPKREQPTATLLGDGRVLVIGGAHDFGSGITLAEIWDPVSDRFSPAGALHWGRSGHIATLLPDGRVLVLGGYTDQAPYAGILLEVWDPDTLSFFPLDQDSPEPVEGSTADRPLTYTATLQADGRVLVVAYDAAGLPVSGGVWDSATNAFSQAASLPAARHIPNGTVLLDGRVLISGGDDADGNSTAAAEIWDPRTETFSPTGSMGEARTGHTATLLQDGRVLVAGGLGPVTRSGHAVSRPTLASSEIWDPTTDTFSPGGSMNTAITYHAAVLLRDGRVLMVGGEGSSPTEVFELR